METNKTLNIPAHVGLIMDGNRRWAKSRLLPASLGHSAGLNRMVALAEKAKNMGIKYLTVYALSTENLSRPKDELDKMFELIKKNFIKNVKKLTAMGSAVKVIGDLSLLPDDVVKIIEDGLKLSPEKASFTFIMAIAYGARSEIIRAANSAAAQNMPLNEQNFSSLLYTKDLPDPDFIIRTGGEIRLSNFLLWQAAYAELYFTPDLFPDFSDEKFEKAIADYSARARRFGRL